MNQRYARNALTLTGSRGRQAIVGIALLLSVKVLLSIMWEYRWYFPLDFDKAAFLIGREQHFHALYRSAFYAHIVMGPIAILLAAFLVVSARSKRYGFAHRWSGRVLLPVMVVLAASGLVMAPYAFGGSVAAVGLSTLAVGTLSACSLSAWYAVRRDFVRHRVWSMRCFLLLFSPLLLRVMSGVMSTLAWESPWFYAFNAWISWVLPLAIHEALANADGMRLAAKGLVPASTVNLVLGRSRDAI